MRCLAVVVALIACGACGVRAPAPVDVEALVAKLGPSEAHRALEVRVVNDARDVGAKLALAALDVQIGRSGEALDAYEAVLRLGGPLGVRWHDADRARFAQLLVARAHARIARGAPTATADLVRAKEYGAVVAADDLARAKQLTAVVELRHVDADVRSRARRQLGVTLGSPAERAAFGLQAWDWGAKREAYEQLAAWHAQTRPPRDVTLQAAYIRALAWWLPADAEPPPRDELAGDDRCWFATADCTPTVRDEVVPAVAAIVGDSRAAGAAHYAATRGLGESDETALGAIAGAFVREPLVADRLARDLAAEAIDSAAANATLGALFDALGDPARARARWKAASEASDEARYLRGLAEACARGGDGAAAMVFVQRAAAADGDPAPVLLAVARDLEDDGAHESALLAAHAAIDLAGVAVLPAAIDVAIAASKAFGRDGQVDYFAHLRSQLAVRVPEPADRVEALAAIRALPNAVTVARGWVVSRAHPGDVELRAALYAAMPADDARRPQLARSSSRSPVCTTTRARSRPRARCASAAAAGAGRYACTRCSRRRCARGRTPSGR